MTLLRLLLYIAIIALVLTILIGWWKKGHKSWLMTFLQNFAGVLFIVSGMVKAIDPIGTAFKMEEYFTEFEYAFAHTWFSFLGPVFQFLSKIALVFSVAMILYEIILGVMLIMGQRSKLISWAFLLLVAFFTVLTGFTYLTGYVPSEASFFEFSKWGPYVVTNMRVTDCGCFGDFIKLEPKISFFKDLGLLIPSFFFVFKHKDMHQLFTPRIRGIITTTATLFVLLFCLNNAVWNLPVVDFRPFKVGTNLFEKREKEQNAAAAVKITAMKLKNLKTGELIEVPYTQYMSELAKYPKTDWKVFEQVKTKPDIEATKVSDFSVTDQDGVDVADDILTDSNDVFLIIAYKLEGDQRTEEFMLPDTLWRVDTVRTKPDSFILVKNVASIVSKSVPKVAYTWDPDYLRDYKEKVNPLMENVMKQGAKVYAIAGGAGSDMENSFKEAIKSEYDWYEADEVLLKTIIRSNPGVVHLKAGKVLEMWHIRHLPSTLKLN
ncbi:MAG: hypothetical protein IPP15_03675 [Saprospiraceae bacterium]|uniref:DoxX family protein n=1 Tax=Candidatus Opimibacter skivensis TaxID=2982028 RepID=A0A9D7ST69_9BACT|nr:hypothetical protein [Candidatus Opimibacter skivensis]